MKITLLIIPLLAAIIFSTNIRADEINIILTDSKTDTPIFIAIYEKEETYLIPELAKYKFEFQFNKNNMYLLKNITSGDYALSVFQDINGNGVLDKSFIGVPKEPYGFSNNATGYLGPPAFKKCLFTISGNTTMEVKLK